MTVRYITVTAVANFFKPATRAFGDIAIVGGVAAVGTTLAAALDNAATTLFVQDSTGFPATPFSIRIESETLSVTATTGNSWTVTRGAGGTTAAAHATGVAVTSDPSGPINVAIPITNPDSVSDPNDPANTKNKKPVDSLFWFHGDLGKAVRTAFAQSPGPSLVWAVRTNGSDIAGALAVVGKLDVQIVLVANKPLTAANTNDIKALVAHVQSLSGAAGGDGKERIGVVMLDETAAVTTAAGLVTGLALSDARLVVVAHRSNDDAAAAVAGTIAGYEPHISLLLKPVGLAMADVFDDSEIETLNSARINWLTRPTLIPGNGLFMGEGYISGDAKKAPYIDITRTIDDVSFRLKAQLIQSIGVLRINRPGLRTLASQMAAVLEPLKQREVIDQYDVFMPLLVLLDKDPATLMPLEAQEIKNARDARTVEAIITVTYAGAIHRLNITLKFQ
jgi:hypothetical protein